MSIASPPASVLPARRPVSLIGVGVDGFPEGRDAAALAALIAKAADAELLLIGVHIDPLVVLPEGMNWRDVEQQAHADLGATRDRFAPGARTVVVTDLSVPRALERVMHSEHRDLLVVGSTRGAPFGVARIGRRTRQLLCHFECPLAVTPRGFHERAPARLRSVGVGFDGGPESHAALSLAAGIASGAGATLRIRGVVDDHMPAVGFSAVWPGEALPEWQAQIGAEVNELAGQARAAADAVGAGAVEVVRGRPVDGLLALCSEVDLMVIGSRRWGPITRVMLGSCGEALLHDAPSPVLVVPRAGCASI